MFGDAVKSWQQSNGVRSSRHPQFGRDGVGVFTLISPFSFRLGPQPMGRCCPRLGWVFIYHSSSNKTIKRALTPLKDPRAETQEMRHGHPMGSQTLNLSEKTGLMEVAMWGQFGHELFSFI